MASTPETQVERRKHPRLVPSRARILCASAEFKERGAPVNLAGELINVGLQGACIATAGRLRPDVKLSVEIRFDDLNAVLRAPGRIVWTDTVPRKEGDLHRAGIAFGRVETTRAVRDYLGGRKVEDIRAGRQASYEDLKREAAARQEGSRPRSRSRTARAIAALLILAAAYFGSYAALVWNGRSGPTAYRYLGPGSTGPAEEALAAFFAPASWAARRAGLPFDYDRP